VRWVSIIMPHRKDYEGKFAHVSCLSLAKAECVVHVKINISRACCWILLCTLGKSHMMSLRSKNLHE
jgi:hypothetical protein